MQPYYGGQPIGEPQIVESNTIGQTAERMFNEGADEVRVTKLRGPGYTRKMPGKSKSKGKKKRKK